MRPVPCHWCGEPLHYEPDRGWMHQEGGLYQMRCPVCGWRGAPPTPPRVCPRCGSPAVEDDHCALPER